MIWIIITKCSVGAQNGILFLFKGHRHLYSITYLNGLVWSHAWTRPGNKQGPLGQKAPIVPQVALVWIQLLIGDAIHRGHFSKKNPWKWPLVLNFLFPGLAWTPDVSLTFRPGGFKLFSWRPKFQHQNLTRPKADKNYQVWVATHSLKTTDLGYRQNNNYTMKGLQLFLMSVWRLRLVWSICLKLILLFI